MNATEIGSKISDNEGNWLCIPPYICVIITRPDKSSLCARRNTARAES